MTGTGLLYAEESYAIQGAIFEVYRELGNGFLETVYQESLEREFKAQSIPYRAQQDIIITYKGAPLTHSFRVDFICYDKIIVEIKAVKDITNEHRAQVMNYLKATGYRLALVVNFGHYPKATVERIIL